MQTVATALLIDRLTSHAEQRPDSPALVADRNVITYAQLIVRAQRVAAALLADDIAPDDRVAIVGRNCAEFLEVFFGASIAGAVPVPINWRLSARETADIIADSSSRVVVLDADTAAVVGRVVDDANLRRVVVFGGPAPRHTTSWRDWTNVDGAETTVTRPAGSTLVQISTSGTTGRAKGVMHSDASVEPTLRAAARVWSVDAGTVMMTLAPWHHVAGLGATLTTLAAGGTAVALNQLDSESIIHQIAAAKVTHLVAAPTVLDRLVQADVDPAVFESLRLVSYGGSPISEQTLALVGARLRCRLVQIYGLSETMGLATHLTPDDHDDPRLRTSCGRAFEQVDLRIVDPTGAKVAVGVAGEVQVRTPTLMSGYHRDPQATARVIDANGWFRTGDIARQDAQGYLYLVDRLDDRIISGGENVYPAEVEAVLVRHPAVEEVAVVGIPHPTWGETPFATVVLRPGTRLDATTLLDFARVRLAHFKCPTGIEFVAALPKNSAGKTLRRSLRERHWQYHARRIN